MGKYLTFSKIGRLGRLANQLFQVSSSYGIATKSGRKLVIPEWKYAQYFENFNIKTSSILSATGEIGEPGFTYQQDFVNNLNSEAPTVGITGYFQSERYFEHCKDDIKRLFSFKQEFKNRLKEEFSSVFAKPVIGIHIRRGDYVGNSNYYQLPIEHYLLALEHEFPNWEQTYNVLVCSDDVNWCKAYFETNNVFFSEGHSDVEDLCLLTQCTHLILSNSSFSWWAAWLGEKENSKIIYPAHYFDGELFKYNNIKDFWPKRWKEFEHLKKKFNLEQATFCIPVLYDHPDRINNLNRVVHYLQENFNTNIIIGEQGASYFSYLSKDFKSPQIDIRYIHFDFPNFHRTRMLNEMYKLSMAPVIVNYDADVIIPPLQLLLATREILRGAAMVFPYDGRFGRIPKHQQELTLNELYHMPLRGARPIDPISVGGCILFDKKKYIEGGMENEIFISYGVEDRERYERMLKLGYPVERIKGILYHYDHYIGRDSSGKNPFFGQGCAELERIRKLSPEQLRRDVRKWTWTHIN